MSEQPPRRQWSKADLSAALSCLLNALYGKTDKAFPLRLPAQSTDADVMLCDALDELEEYRTERHVREKTHVVLTRLAHMYEDRARAGRRLMNGTTDLESAARHAIKALQWEQCWQVVLQVAKHLEIHLSVEPEARESPPTTFSQESLCDTGGHVIAHAKDLGRQANTHPAWRVEALYDGRMLPQVEYEGQDYGVVSQSIGGLCLNVTVDKVFVWRDGEKYRHIEVR